VKFFVLFTAAKDWADCLKRATEDSSVDVSESGGDSDETGSEGEPSGDNNEGAMSNLFFVIYNI